MSERVITGNERALQLRRWGASIAMGTVAVVSGLFAANNTEAFEAPQPAVAEVVEGTTTTSESPCPEGGEDVISGECVTESTIKSETTVTIPTTSTSSTPESTTTSSTSTSTSIPGTTSSTPTPTTEGVQPPASTIPIDQQGPTPYNP